MGGFLIHPLDGVDDDGGGADGGSTGDARFGLSWGCINTICDQ